jgi:DNA-binding transcriptional regulator YdaS (Cro superfamily)
MKSIQEINKQQQAELERLIEYAGSKARLAESLGVSRQIVYYWLKRGRISAGCALDVERITNGAFKAAELRPDVVNWMERSQ